MNPKLAAVIGLICGVVIGFTWAILKPSNTWKLALIEKGTMYPNVHYPAYLFNSYNGELWLVGHASYDNDRDGKIDRYEVIKYLINNPSLSSEDYPAWSEALPVDD